MVTADQVLISKMNAPPVQRGYELFISAAQQVIFYLASDLTSFTNCFVVTTVATLPLSGVDKEVNIKVTYNGNSSGTGVNIYFNDVLQAVTLFNPTITTTTVNSEPLLHGARANVITTPLRGRMRDVAIFGSVLNSTQRAEVTAAAMYSSLNSLPTAPAPLNHWKYNDTDVKGTNGILDYGSANNPGTAHTVGVNKAPTVGITTLTTAADLPDGNLFEVVCWGAGGSGGPGNQQTSTSGNSGSGCGGGGGARKAGWFSRAELVAALPIVIRNAPISLAPPLSTANSVVQRGRFGLGSQFGRLLVAYGGGEGTNNSTNSAGSGGGFMGPGRCGHSSGVRGGAPVVIVSTNSSGPGVGGAGAGSFSIAAGGDGYGPPACGGGGAAGGSATSTAAAGEGGIADLGGGGGGAAGGVGTNNTLASAAPGMAGGLSGVNDILDEIPTRLNGFGGAGGVLGTTTTGVAGSAGAAGNHYNSGSGGGGGSPATDLSGTGGAGGAGGTPGGGGGGGGTGRGADGTVWAGKGGDGGKGRVTITAYA